MTLENCKKRAELAKTPEEKAFWEARIARKLRLRKYAHLRVVEEPAPVAPTKKKGGKKNG